MPSMGTGGQGLSRTKELSPQGAENLDKCHSAWAPALGQGSCKPGAMRALCLCGLSQDNVTSAPAGLIRHTQNRETHRDRGSWGLPGAGGGEDRGQLCNGCPSA